MAADELQLAIELAPGTPGPPLAIGQAFAERSRCVAIAAWQRCLALNPNHLPCLLSLTDRAIDGEDRAATESLLQRINSINPREPRQFVYRGLLAHLDGDFDQADQWLQQARELSPGNAEIEVLLGRKLSQKYRFAEGVEALRRALELSPNHRAAQLQLGQDLLRLGDEEGWTWIARVREEDPFQVTAYNLVQLRTELNQFETIEGGGFVIRMERHEAELYGDEVLATLLEARDELCRRYDHELTQPVLVEIFSRPSDFAVRTFGVPGASGYLGVCFGHLITVSGPAANSPPSSSWKSVLWHEFTHTVTLGKTRHRIPRWLSEGLSVMEEGRRDPMWSRRASSAERRRILDGQTPPVSELSELFLNPQAPSDINLAYLLSGWVAEFLVETQDEAAVRGLLEDLGVGISLEEALGRRWGNSASIDTQFADYTRRRALLEGWLDPDVQRWREQQVEQGVDLSPWLPDADTTLAWRTQVDEAREADRRTRRPTAAIGTNSTRTCPRLKGPWYWSRAARPGPRDRRY
ncbi:MAG: hypothetical protein R3B96_00580 [Pirellulaceae bacterium]